MFPFRRRTPPVRAVTNPVHTKEWCSCGWTHKPDEVAITNGRDWLCEECARREAPALAAEVERLLHERDLLFEDPASRDAGWPAGWGDAIEVLSRADGDLGTEHDHGRLSAVADLLAIRRETAARAPVGADDLGDPWAGGDGWFA